MFKLAEGPIDRRTYRFQRNPLSKSPAVLRRRDLTSAFDHDLLVTDRYCVTGGPGGEILVWDYLNPDEHALPYEIPAWCSGVGPNDEFTRSYTGLTMSADGRYLGATMSDQLVIIDMVGKTVSGRYSNGRKIDPRRVHARHLQDPFPPGVWCCWKEWDVDGRECGDGVGYLNRAGYLYPPNRHGLQPQRPRWMYHGVSGLFLLVNMVVFLLYGWGDLVLVWGLATALIVAYLNW